MRLPNNLGLKVYIALFALFCLSHLASLCLPTSEAFIYYNTLFTFYAFSRILYMFAILDAALACLSVIPMALLAFERPQQNVRFFQWLFFLRLATLLPGNNYQYVIVKSAFHGSMLLGVLTLGIWALFILPSFKEHHAYAFKK